jgi:hypothetical protein
MLNIGWQIADIACHFKATNEQVIAAIREHRVLLCKFVNLQNSL